jgi:hypothetical protein
MSREEMIGITEKGKDKMPGFEKEMTKDQIISIIDYVIALKKSRVEMRDFSSFQFASKKGGLR